eukprot:7813470-Ditylum_brightwellii.AAC.1
MAISTIKYDQDGHTKSVKWWMVALVNLDPHTWSSEEVFAPVMTMLEFHVLVSLAIHHKRPLKSGDVKKSFVKATLPETEQYIIQPPAGCPNSKSNTYWLLKQTLYGLNCNQ